MHKQKIANIVSMGECPFRATQLRMQKSSRQLGHCQYLGNFCLAQPLDGQQFLKTAHKKPGQSATCRQQFARKLQHVFATAARAQKNGQEFVIGKRCRT